MRFGCGRVPALYLEDHEGRRGGSLIAGLSCAVLLAWLVGAVPAAAQQTPDDAAAREYFERGRVAFEQADYESALVYFRHAYRLSQRGELQYNIGVAADRLQREEEALEAFEHYLDESKDPAREAEVRERIDRAATVDRGTRSDRARARRSDDSLSRPPTTRSERRSRVPSSAIIGGERVGGGRCCRCCGDECRSRKERFVYARSRGQMRDRELRDGVDLGVRRPRHRGSGGQRDLVCDGREAQQEKRKTQVSLSPTGVMVSGTF